MRTQLTLTAAARQFWRRRSPRLLAASLLTATAARALVGDFRASDAVVPVVVLMVYPFFEWTVHVAVLHWRPRTIAGIRLDPELARMHRLHHADPRDPRLIFIPWRSLLVVLPVLTALSLLAFGRPGLGLTFLVVVLAIGLCYEWTHYLVHTDYTPRTTLYRAIRRNHRLHHFKNERYWFSVTTSGTSDRLLGTYPDPDRVPNSPTARALHGG
ncbi:sterol desaturase family protein [Longispora sp. K20-0274]|uniref:sterol desaturase family protein n=1 Tax=Longispora sp. K20-0274 TaxID=3088255 RepID=UPI00399AF6DB